MAKFDVSQITRSPKSTAIGLCVLALAAERGIHFDATGRLAMSSRDWFEVGCGVLTAVVSGFSQDAEPARVDGQQATSEPPLAKDDEKARSA